MRVLQRLTILLFLLILAAFAAYKALDILVIDHAPPVIRMDTDIVEISVNDPRETLLSGITASDRHDGDLTSEVIIRGISQLITDDSARVYYVVFDKAGNMAVAQRTVRYTDYEKPHFSLREPLVFPQHDTIFVDDLLHASDRIDGDLSKAIRVTTQNVNTALEGTYSLSIMVTNSLGDSETLSLPVIVNTSSANCRQLRLSRYILYLDRGEAFDPLSMITAMYDNTGKLITTDTDEVVIAGQVDTETTGVYNLLYTYETYSVYLTVVVK